jgi:hypothetical protein
MLKLTMRLFLLFLLPTQSGRAATTVNVGVLSFDILIPAGNGSPAISGFNIVNFTEFSNLEDVYEILVRLRVAALGCVFETRQYYGHGSIQWKEPAARSSQHHNTLGKQWSPFCRGSLSDPDSIHQWESVTYTRRMEHESGSFVAL